MNPRMRYGRLRAFAACWVALIGLAAGTPLWGQTAPAAEDKPAAPKKIRVAVFPPFVAPCQVNCGSPLTNSQIAYAAARALDAAKGIEIVHTTEATEGKSIDNDPDITRAKVWQSGGYPEPEPNISIRKSKELEVDGVILMRFRWDYAEIKGDVFFVDGRISRVRTYDFGAFRVGRLNLNLPVSLAVEQLAEEASKVKGRQSVAVLELESENADTGAALAIGEALRNELNKTERFTVMEASEMAAILDRLTPTKKVICTAVECALEAGKLLGVDKVVAGRITGLDTNTWKVSVIQVDVATGETITSESTRHKGSLGTAGRSMALMADELAVSASPEGASFRYEQRKWRWKTGLVMGGVVVMALGAAYLAEEVKASNERQKDNRIQAESATTQSEFDKWSEKLDDEKATGQTLRNQAIFAELAAAGLLYWGWTLYRNPPELTPVGFQVQPTSPGQGGLGVAFLYQW